MNQTQSETASLSATRCSTKLITEQDATQSCDKSLRVKVWDVGGQDKTRHPKCQYCQGTDGLIYVVTATIETGSKVQQKTVEMPQLQYVDEVADISIVIQRQVPMLHSAQKTVQVPQMQCTG